MVNKAHQKSTVNAFNVTSQTVPVAGLLTFTGAYTTGCSIELSQDEQTIHINKPGVYQVIFDASAVQSTTAGLLTVQMFKNGQKVIPATAAASSTTATDVESFGFSTIVEVGTCNVCCVNPVSLTFVNTGIAAIFSILDVTVVKLA